MRTETHESPSLLLHNGRIRTLVPGAPDAAAIRFRRGKVDWVGGAGAALPEADQYIDLAGRTLLPGLIDAHAHLLWIAQERLQWNLAAPDAPGSLVDLLDVVRERCRNLESGQWLVANGLHEQRYPERRLPTATELDAASGGVRVMLRRACGHTVVANSAAMAAVRIGADSFDPEGGVIERAGGVLTGVLRETAAFPLYAAVPRPSAAELAASLREVARECLALGLTSVVEAAVGFTNGFDAEWQAWEMLRESGSLPLRMAFMLRLDPVEAALRGLVPTGPHPWWQVNTLKFFSDGVFGGRTAALHAPYCACASQRGLLVQDAASLRRKLLQAAEADWQLGVHAIGDHGIDVALDALAEARRLPGVPHRIEHLSLPSASALAHIRALNIAVVAQFSFASRMGAAFGALVGEARADALYPARRLLDLGIVLAGSSDAPAGALCPFESMADAVRRTTPQGQVIGSGERIGIEDALRAYTAGAAAALGQAGQRGVLAPGAVADAVVIDQDPYAVPAETLSKIRVQMTIVGGALAWSR
ncbi:N-substituted formamide deformylase precursor [Variovorax boronicumulans]|uniref:amidohydrolase n=1 Tax=Variovorax boronicumulans TaxID=436515 RepID=UPI000FB4373F|nr:amidohydrolase [Variovorax boronicumulans]PBI87758.1 N-substituted formamide deformylase precursor [Variovorax boronicumulans]